MSFPVDPRVQLVSARGPDFLREEGLAPCSTPPHTHRAHTHRGLGGDERSQHAATRGPWGAEGDTQVATPQGQAVCPLLCLFSHLSRLVLQHSEALQLPVLAVCQLGGGDAEVRPREQ